MTQTVDYASSPGPAVPGAAGEGLVAPSLPTPAPTHRRLQVFSLDPAMDARLEDSLISRSVLRVAWEEVKAGPVGEYLEVVDVDPSSGCVYDPVNLGDPHLLAQDGLSPSAGNPQFHQQMAYAVAMRTIANFEEALGRRVLWAERRRDDDDRFITDAASRYVQRLRIYPHALRDQNAYYSPAKVALLFGYFNATTADPREELPGGLVFTCLSHDIVAHETTHAVLDGMHRRMLDASNGDMLAFHEAFADLVAIFQHFTLPGLLLEQIQRTRGELQANNVLARLAGQFARATGRGDALRNALGSFDAAGRRQPPDPTLIVRAVEPHERGAILVAAVFDAFLKMYQSRVADLRRIASGGLGILPEGDIHPDLARRFAEEAVKLSQRVLHIVIRAIDYLPPVDVTFGDFLRAIVTADSDFFPVDERRYRLAFIESFRDRGIYPLDVRALAEDALRWTRVDRGAWPLLASVLPPPAVLRTMAAAWDSSQMSQWLGAADGGGTFQGIRDSLARGDFETAAADFLHAAWLAAPRNGGTDAGRGDRYARYLMERTFAAFVHEWIQGKARQQPQPFPPAMAKELGWHLGLDFAGLCAPDAPDRPLEVHAVRPTLRLRPDGRSGVELLIVLTQRVSVPLLMDPADPRTVMTTPDGQPLSFWFRGGSTLIVDPEAGTVTYSVGKNILSEGRKRRQMAFLRGQLAGQGTAAILRYGLTPHARERQRRQEPFAFAHSRAHERGTY